MTGNPLARRAGRLFAAALAGATLALTLPPVDFVPAIAAWALLVWLVGIGEARARRPWLERALLGAGFGFGYHLAGLWWTGAAFLVDAAVFGPLLPLGVIGLPLLLAPFHALAVVLMGCGPRSTGWRVVTLGVAVSFTEWLRGAMFTGFPWNVPAVQLSGINELVQSASVVGVHGLAVAAVLIGAAPAALVTRGSRWAGVLGVTLLVTLAAYGTLRRDGAAPDLSPQTVRIVQPSVPQEQKWDPAERAAIWATLLDLTTRPRADGTAPSLVVWPETALPFLYRTPGRAQDELAAALLPGQTLVTGAVEIEPETPAEAAGAGSATVSGAPEETAPGRATNSIFVLDSDGVLRQRYDKRHLVPFGEYLPFAGVLSRLGFTAIVQGTSQFVAGTERVLIDVPDLPQALPLICYEIVFRQDVTGASWIVTVTNDAWFGDTPGPRQHLRHAELRAIETGLAIVRAANNGISGVIDPYGRLVAELPLNRRDVLDARIPAPVATPYRTFGDRPLYALWLLSVVCVVILGIRHRRKPREDADPQRVHS